MLEHERRNCDDGRGGRGRRNGGDTPQPKPTPVPQPKPTPVPQPKPTPVPQPKPTPVPQPKPTPVPQPKPTPVPQPKPAPVPQPNSKIPVALPGNMDPNMCDRILQLVCIAENSNVNWTNYYNYCEDIGDGRGYTISIVGFCSGTGDFIQVLYALKSINPNHLLVKYIPLVEKVDGTSSTKGLEGLPGDLKKMGSNDKDFNKAAWSIIIKLYWGPAMAYAAKIGCVTPLTKYILYDTILNFGDLDGFKNLKSKPPAIGGDEKTWLAEFLNKKQSIIEKDGSLGDTKDNRVAMQKSILAMNNTGLTSPLKVSCYGDSFSL